MDKPTALVADDETVVRRLCGRILEGLGYQVTMVSQGLEALKAIEEQSFAVVISDLRMPELDGIQLLNSIKKIRPETNVVVISGYATLDNAIEALRAGAVDYLRKPFTAEELQMAIKKCETKRGLAQEQSELREMTGIYDLGSALSSTLLLEEIMSLFLDLTTRLFKSSRALLFLLESNSGNLYVEQCRGLPEQKYKGLCMDLRESSFGEALSRERPCLIEDQNGDPLFSQLSEGGEVPKGLLWAPLVARGKILGGLLLYPKDNGERFGPSDERAISIMACQTAIAIENARLHEAHQRRISELTKINELANLLDSRLSDPSFLHQVVKSLEGLFEFDVCAFLLPSPVVKKILIFASLSLTDALRHELKEKMAQEFSKHSRGKFEGEEFEMDLFPREPSLSDSPPASLGTMLFLPLAIKDHLHGLIGFVRAREEPFDSITFKTINTVSRLIALAFENQQLYAGIRDNYLSTVHGLSAAVEAKDPYSRDHSFYTAKYAKGLAQKLGFTQERVDEIVVAALLHDVGKIGIPESILCKTERLSPEEYKNMQRHPALGARILESVNFPWDLKPMILSHHEHFDGSGYPSGLKGEEIPLGARILAIAEAYEVMIAGRPYQKPLTRPEAAQRLKECAGTHFDPQLIPHFVEISAKKEED